MARRKRNSSLLTHGVTLVPRGYLRKRNRGDQASIRPWRLANYYNYRNWRCAIRPGKGQSRAPLRGYPSPSLLYTNPIFILACRVSIINTTAALLHTRAITQATDAGRIILPASLRFVLIGRPYLAYLYILQLEESRYRRWIPLVSLNSRIFEYIRGESSFRGWLINYAFANFVSIGLLRSCAQRGWNLLLGQWICFYFFFFLQL